jgi:capsular polysaccharide biosynthesis protein
LFFPQIPAPTGNPSPRAVAWLRSRLLPTVSAPRATRKLYISRRDAPQRRLLNEDEIARFARGHDFEVVSLGDTPVAEQIKLFREARTIMAPHGAGVTNVLFSPPGATIIEFFGTNYINGCYWALANICGHRHAFLTGEPTGLDYRISRAQLEQLLAGLCEN